MPRLRARAPPLTVSSAPPTASSTRPRRGTTNKAPNAAVIERSSPEEKRQSIHLTVKASPNKLRQATSGRIAKTAVSSRNIVSGKRSSRNSRVVREVDSDEDEEDDEQDDPDAMDVDEDDEDEDDEDAEGEEDDEVDAEGEEDDEMDVTPAPRIVVSSTESVRVKPVVEINAPQDSVEAKEMAMDDDDDEELSELDSDLEEEDAEGEDEDAEGEEDDDIPVANDDEDEDMDSDDETPGSMSRSHTPDLSKMTKRQRAKVVEDDEGALLMLSNEAQKKKHFTEEENAMRRAEMARRRKNLSEKRNEEEKLDTINRLLKKQPSKRQKRIQEITEDDLENEPEVERVDPLYTRHMQKVTDKGVPISQMGIPEEWLQGPVGNLFAGPMAKPSGRPHSGRMVEEVA